jgi:dTDP-4-amino-4,6-dideoxygalactose transaminase
VWKPMHLQPAYASASCLGGDVAADLFATGLCLPSGSNLSDAEFDEIAGVVRGTLR